jgi:hypothetical protein
MIEFAYADQHGIIGKVVPYDAQRNYTLPMQVE